MKTMRGLHHLHIRKRRAAGLEPFPARHGWMRTLDAVVMAAGIIAPLMTIPQILKIFVLQDAQGISILTWASYALFDIPWIIYGFAHHSRPIATTYILWFLMNLSVVVGALLYGVSSL